MRSKVGDIQRRMQWIFVDLQIIILKITTTKKEI